MRFSSLLLIVVFVQTDDENFYSNAVTFTNVHTVTFVLFLIQFGAIQSFSFLNLNSNTAKRSKKNDIVDSTINALTS